MKKSIIVEIISYYFFLLFIYTALSKWFIFTLFVNDLERAPITSLSPMIFALIIPAAELLVAVGILFEKTRKISLISAFILMLTFTLYVGYVLGMTTERPCSCGGIFRDMSWQNHLYFNFFSTLLALLGFFLHRRMTQRPTTMEHDSKSIFAK